MNKPQACTRNLVGLIGEGIQASRSPRLHEQEARELGLQCYYHLLDTRVLGWAVDAVDALPALLAAAQLLGFGGVNVTHPYKQSVISLLDELSPEAAAIGAVNTVVFTAGKRFGHNTDWWGFAESFRRGLADVPRGRVVLLGAGGAGSAVGYAALTLGSERLAIHDLNAERAAALVQRLKHHFGAQRVVLVTDLEAAMLAADGLIQTTPVGMVGHPGLPIPAAWLRSELWVAEVVYFPLVTELLKQARALGCRALDGGGMAVFQAAEAFRLFTGVVPDAERMLQHFASMDA